MSWHAARKFGQPRKKERNSIRERRGQAEWSNNRINGVNHWWWLLTENGDWEQGNPTGRENRVLHGAHEARARHPPPSSLTASLLFCLSFALSPLPIEKPQSRKAAGKPALSFVFAPALLSSSSLYCSISSSSSLAATLLLSVVNTDAFALCKYPLFWKERSFSSIVRE